MMKSGTYFTVFIMKKLRVMALVLKPCSNLFVRPTSG